MDTPDALKILICTTGSPRAPVTLHFGTLIARHVRGPTTLLQILGKRLNEARARDLSDRVRQMLDLPNWQCKIRQGEAAREILREIEAGDYDLVVVGSHGLHGIARLLRRSPTLEVVHYARTNVLVVKADRPALQRMLICTAGGICGEVDVRYGGWLAAFLGAEVTVLHVMSQLPLTPAAEVADLLASAEDLIQRGTREGQHLSRCLAILAELGVAGRAKVRHGLVVNEILAEAQEGDYDLIVLGAHDIHGLGQLLLNDVSNEVLSAADRPVLIVRSQPEAL